MEVLKKAVFSDPKILKSTRSYQDSLRREGLIYLIEDIWYINGPYLSSQDKSAATWVGEGDTVTFSFENLNTKATLKWIENIVGDFEWHTELPKHIRSSQLKSYYDNAEFKVRATNVDRSKDYKFKMYFEDSRKGQHIYLVSKKSESSLYSYDCIRVFD